MNKPLEYYESANKAIRELLYLFQLNNPTVLLSCLNDAMKEIYYLKELIKQGEKQ